jgi:hypothetical protein
MTSLKGIPHDAPCSIAYPITDDGDLLRLALVVPRRHDVLLLNGFVSPRDSLSFDDDTLTALSHYMDLAYWRIYGSDPERDKKLTDLSNCWIHHSWNATRRRLLISIWAPLAGLNAMLLYDLIGEAANQVVKFLNGVEFPNPDFDLENEIKELEDLWADHRLLCELSRQNRDSDSQFRLPIRCL